MCMMLDNQWLLENKATVYQALPILYVMYVRHLMIFLQKKTVKVLQIRTNTAQHVHHVGQLMTFSKKT